MEHLSGIAIFERDFSGDQLLTWCFPNLEKKQEGIIHEQLTYLSDQDDSNKLNPATATPTPLFYFSKHLETYHYVKRYNLPEKSNKDITQMSLVILAKDLHPEKYESLLNTLVDIYFVKRKKSTTTYLLQQYLSAFGTGRVKNPSLPFNAKDFSYGEKVDPLLKVLRKGDDEENAGENPFKGAPISSKDLESVVKYFSPITFVNHLWTAFLIRRKVLVYSQDVKKLLLYLSSFPWLVCHQKSGLDVRLVFDFTQCEVQVEEMQELSSFLVGTTTFPPMEGEEGYIEYDVFVNLDSEEEEEERKVVLSAKSKDLFSSRTGIHQEMVRYLTEAKEGVDGEEIFRTINDQNAKVIQRLKMLHKNNEGDLTVNDFKELKMDNELRSFLINIATAEGLITME